MVKKLQTNNGISYTLASARILLGSIFLWAFFDKLFGLGFATPVDKAWLHGGSPTSGFLGAVDGPFHSIFNSLAGLMWVDWLFMLGLLGIGLALFIGVGVRIAATTGSLLLLMMWAAQLPSETNPLIDDHLIYIAVLIAIACQEIQLLSLRPLVDRLGFFKRNR